MEIGSEPDAALLVGRAEQYRELIDVLVGDRNGAVVLGPSGVGKSVMVRAACHELSFRFHAVHVRGSTVSSKTPYGALGWLLTELPGGATTSPLLLLPRLHAHLQLRAGERELLIVVDNADLLDSSSAAVIAQLVRGFSARVVATAESLAGRGAAEIASLWSDGLIARMDLEPLDRRQTATLMEQLLDGRVSARASVAMWTESGGNPHYVTLLTREQRDAGTLVRRGGTWVLAAPFVHTGEISELMAARMARLTQDERKLVEVLAFMVVLPLEVVLGLVPPQAVEEMEERCTIEVVGRRRPSVRISTVATGPLVADAVPPGRSCQLWEEVAALVRPEQLEAPAVAAFASWTLHCGARLDPVLALSAARLENASGNSDGALRYLRCIPSADRTREAVAEEVESLTRLGRIAEASRRTAAYLSHPAGQGHGEGESQLELRLMQSRLEHLMGDTAGAVRILDDAAEEPGLDPVSRARIDLLRNAMTVDAGQSRTAEPRRLDAIAADPELPQRVRFAALAAGAELHASLGDGTAAKERSMAAKALLGRELPGVWQDLGHSRLFTASLLSGDLTAAGGFSWEHLTVPPLQVTYRGSAGDIARGMAALLGGRVDDAVDLLSSAVNQLMQGDPDDHLPLARAALASGLAFQGETERAAAVAAEAGTFKFRRSWALEQMRILLLLLAAPSGAVPSARERIFEMARQARSRGQTGMALLELAAAALVFPGDDVVKELAAASAEASGDWAGALAGFAEGLQEADPARLIAAARSALGLDQYAIAHAAARAARKLLGASRSRMQQEARSLETAAHRVLRRSNGFEHRFQQLTPFEQSLARQAAGSLSRLEISAALNLSPRTVDWHLGKIFAKLNVSGRAELQELLA